MNDEKGGVSKMDAEPGTLEEVNRSSSLCLCGTGSLKEN